MTLASIGSAFWPAHTVNTSSSRHWLDGALGTIDAASRRVAMVFGAKSTDAIIGAQFCVRTVAGAETVRVSIQGVDASGQPDGTIKASGNCYFDVAVSATNNTGYSGTFTSSYTPSAVGEVLALVIEDGPSWSSGDIDIMDLAGMGVSLFGYSLTYNGSAWTKRTDTPAMGVEYSGNRCYPNSFAFPVDSNSSTVNVDGSPRYFGLKFELAAPMRIAGINMSADVNGQDWTLELYSGSDAPGSPTATLLSGFDKDVQARTVTSSGCFPFPPQSLAKDTVYRIVMNVNASGNNIAHVPVEADKWKEAFGFPNGKLSNCHSCQANDGAGSWDDSTYALYIPAIALEVDQFDDGAGGGGGGGGTTVPQGLHSIEAGITA